jgi:thiazole synthase
MSSHDPFTVAGREFGSRLLTGTGKYDTFETMREALTASGSEIVTVAVRRIDLEASGDDITTFLPEGVLLLPNTSGCETADEAVGGRGPAPAQGASPTG